MPPNLDDTLTVETCESDGEYSRTTDLWPLDDTPTTPIQSDARGRQVVVGPDSQVVVIDYNAAAENERSLRRTIAQLLKR